MNYFELFGLVPAPVVDKSLLARKYFELQKQSHPDFFTAAAEEERALALEQSAAINKAFGIFQDEQKTLGYFLEEIGVIKPEEKYSLPAEFLMEMMEMNEEPDPRKAASAVIDYEHTLDEKFRQVIRQFSASTVKEPELLQLKEYYYKKKYLKRILDRLVD
jgi:molecular chaperone HscB